MKKIFTMIVFAAGVSFAASAQNRDDRYNNDRYPADQQNNNWNQDDRRQSKEYGDRQQSKECGDRQQSRDYGYSNRNRRNVDSRGQQEYDRMNRDCDRRIDGYRNDRRMNSYERDRQIQQAEYERQQRNRSFGTGLVVGGIAAIILGAIISHQ